jgi:hypothetical protein
LDANYKISERGLRFMCQRFLCSKTPLQIHSKFSAIPASDCAESPARSAPARTVATAKGKGKKKMPLVSEVDGYLLLDRGLGKNQYLTHLEASRIRIFSEPALQTRKFLFGVVGGPHVRLGSRSEPLGSG